ncbi:MAG TPA: glycosyltransferase [Puia sp.]|nr:glycosyltransferase [Puia sp.]
MQKILWLTSWYPNKTDMFTGDFIQRHAKAVSKFYHVIVLHVAKADHPFFPGESYEEINQSENLTEHIVYYKCDTPLKPLNKFNSLLKYKKIFRKLILVYKNESIPLSHVHVPLKAGLLGMWLKQKYKVPYILTEHYGIYNNIVDEPFNKRDILFKFFTKKIIRESAIFSPVSRNVGVAINKMVIDKPFSVVYNTVDISLFYYKPATSNKFRFIHVSNMHPLKNVEGIIHSFAAVWQENIELELVLVGKYDNSILELAQKTQMLDKSIFFTGEISYDEVAKQMQTADAFILFSKTENMPCVILESLCCGLPVISTNVGGIPEVVNESNGILIESANEDALKEAIRIMVKDYHQYNRAAISKNAIQKFSYEEIGKQISQLYQQVLFHQLY